MFLKPHNIAAALLLAACTPAPLPETTAGSTSTSTPPLPPITTDDPTTTSTGSSDTPTTTTPNTTTSPSDTTSSFLLPPPDSGGGKECDQWNEDCPEGQKCMPYSGDGDNAWESLKCVDIVPNPAAPGEPCTVFGSGVSGEDTCDKHAMCWDIDPDTLTGTCIAMCIGSPDAPGCEYPMTLCTVSGDGVITLCLPTCDLLKQDCPNGDLCLPQQGGWGNLCVLDASGDEGQAFDPCEHADECDPGLVCTSPVLALECDPQALGCCLPFCDLSQPNTCPGENQQCLPWYEQGQAPPGDENVGLCALPQP